jgi:hypothetical protein
LWFTVLTKQNHQKKKKNHKKCKLIYVLKSATVDRFSLSARISVCIWVYLYSPPLILDFLRKVQDTERFPNSLGSLACQVFKHSYMGHRFKVLSKRLISNFSWPARESNPQRRDYKSCPFILDKLYSVIKRHFSTHDPLRSWRTRNKMQQFLFPRKKILY